MIVSVIVSVVIWGAVLVILLRMLSSAGICFSNNKVLNFLCSNTSRGLSDEVTKKSMLNIFLLALLFRVIIFLISFTAVAFWSNSTVTFKSFFQQYVQWDVNNYQRIADLGYAGFDVNGDFSTLVFLPLYPWIARFLSLIFRNTYISLMFISFVSYAVGCSFLYKLCALDYGKSTAAKAVVYISVFPHALFFGSMMNESMFFMLIVITLYSIRCHKWWLVGIFGACASLTRLVGILLAFPAFCEFIEHYEILQKIKNKEYKETALLFMKKGSPVLIMLSGIIIYLLCNYKVTGECFKFLEYQHKYWFHQTTYFGLGIRNVIKNAMNAVNSGKSMLVAAIHIPSIVSIIFVIAAAVYGLRKSRSMYSIYLIVYFIVNMSVDYIVSTSRYMLCAVPAFIFLAEFGDRHKWSDSLITASMAVGMGIYLSAYLFSKQIV